MPFEYYEQVDPGGNNFQDARSAPNHSRAPSEEASEGPTVVYGLAISDLPAETPSSSRRQRSQYNGRTPPPAYEPAFIPRPSASLPRRVSSHAASTTSFHSLRSPEMPPSPRLDMPPSPRLETSPMLGEKQSNAGYYSPSLSDLSHYNGSVYSLDNKSTEHLQPVGDWPAKEYATVLPSLKHGRVNQKSQSRRIWWIIGLLVLIVIAAVAVVVPVVLTSSKHAGSTSDHAAAVATTSSSASPTTSSAASAPTVALWGTTGSTVVRDDGTTFDFQSPLGGSWCNVPFNDTAQAQADIPRLDQPWDYAQNSINGVNLGGWLVPEPFVVPSLYEPFENATTPAVDEWTLCFNLGANLETVLTQHYDTFITEDDFYKIAAAGLNWVRIGLPFWAIETIAGEPYLEGVAWTYFLKAIKWARKYGLRINLDFHTVPGGQNGWNHAGRLHVISFLHGPMGVVNAQRTLNYIRTLTEFISQPQYTNVVPMFSFINEPMLPVIGRPPLLSFYHEAYTMIRQITGIGKGPFLMIHDGFQDPALFNGFMSGADRVGLDSHPYLAFSDVVWTMPKAIAVPCNQWSGQYNTTMNAFGFAMAGEWSLAVNDCGEWLVGVNQGTRFEGTYPTKQAPLGSCAPWTDYTQWTPQFKQQLSDYGSAQMDATRNWFFWTWKVGNSTKLGRVPSPLWSYSLALEQGYIPANPRAASGSCPALMQEYNNGVNAAAVPFTAFLPWQTGGAGAGTITDPDLNAYSAFPPGAGQVTGDVASLRWTATGNPVTLPTPTYLGGSMAGNGWANPTDTASWYVPRAGAVYPNEYVTGVARNGQYLGPSLATAPPAVRAR